MRRGQALETLDAQNHDKLFTLEFIDLGEALHISLYIIIGLTIRNPLFKPYMNESRPLVNRAAVHLVLAQ
jgi:hypothetical protein